MGHTSRERSTVVHGERTARKAARTRASGRAGFRLAAQTMQWATPSVADTTGGRMARSGDRSDEPLLKGQAANLDGSLADADIIELRRQSPAGQQLQLQRDNPPSLFPPGPSIYPVGGIPSKERRSLNPLFVEWLMGWPPGWTLLAWTDFACSETALSALEAAYAVRTLATRLAASGSASAARLVRMMVSA
jgi:hypothetical protein